jgi:hypothetical protein
MFPETKSLQSPCRLPANLLRGGGSIRETKRRNNGDNVSRGIYLLEVDTGNKSLTNDKQTSAKMTIIK